MNDSCNSNQLFQFSSVIQSCPTLCDPMNRSTPGLPVHHHLPEFTQTLTESVMPSSHLIPGICVFPVWSVIKCASAGNRKIKSAQRCLHTASGALTEPAACVSTCRAS